MNWGWRNSPVSNWMPSDELRQLAEDQRERWHQGDRRLVEQYFEDHPELRSDEKLLLDFVCSEFSLRQEHGETPTLAEYVERFPALAMQLELLFEVLQAIDSAPSLHAFESESRILSQSISTHGNGLQRTGTPRRKGQPPSAAEARAHRGDQNHRAAAIRIRLGRAAVPSGGGGGRQARPSGSRPDL